MDKSTSKVRLVFDCSAKCEGISLKDVIHPGPKLQKNLFDVLVRFRRSPIALACDIKKMFLQIEVQEKDRSYFRILWRNLDVDQEPQEYKFNRVVFGKNAALMEVVIYRYYGVKIIGSHVGTRDHTLRVWSLRV